MGLQAKVIFVEKIASFGSAGESQARKSQSSPTSTSGSSPTVAEKRSFSPL
jgi:hypothetical protein